MIHYSVKEVLSEVADMGEQVDENQMTRILMKCEVDPKEPTEIPFRGFERESIKLQVVPDMGREHDHLHLCINGKYIGYLHIDAKDIHFYSPNDKSAYIFFKDAK